MERILRAWGDSTKSPLDAAKSAMQELLAEYLNSGDVAEARRCLRALNARRATHLKPLETPLPHTPNSRP